MADYRHVVDDPPVRPGWYRVLWVCDLPKADAATPREAAAAALDEQMEAASLVANPFYVIDGDTGLLSEHDLAQ